MQRVKACGSVLLEVEPMNVMSKNGKLGTQQSALSGLEVTKEVASYVPVVGSIIGGLIDLFSPDPDPVAPPPPPKEKFQVVTPPRQQVPLAPRPDMNAQMVQTPASDRSAAFANMMRSPR